MAKSVRKKSKKKSALKVEEAIENLTTIAEMDADHKTPIGIIQNTKIITNEEDFDYSEIEWLYPEDRDGFLDKIKPTFIAILDYFKDLYNDEETDWEGDEINQSLPSIMEMVVGAATNLDKYFSLFNIEVEFLKSKEFTDIRNFYLDSISLKLPEKIAGSKKWDEQWESNKEGESLDLDKSGAKDFSVIESDENYELFYIRNINGEMLFSPDLIRNIKLFTYFEDNLKIEDNLFAKIEELCKKDIHFSAKQILRVLDKDIHKFYSYKFDKKHNELAKNLNKAFISLMLASNDKIYSKKGFKKSTHQYFSDFQYFLRRCFRVDEYQKTLDMENVVKDKKSLFLLGVAANLSYALFTRLGGVKQEVIGYIHRMIRKGKEEEKLDDKASFWNKLIENDDNLRSYLSDFPNGSIMKIVKDIENIPRTELCFDPLIQGNIPQKLYEISIKDKKIDVLHLPCPIHQEMISKASLTDEYLGFLRSFKSPKDKFLLFDLQDNRSWRESARSKAVSDIQARAEFEGRLTVVTLSKSSNFYNQIEQYEKVANASSFINSIKKEIFINKESGLYFPLKLSKNIKFIDFIDNICPEIHKSFFQEKKDLSKQERKDYIELFYHFLVLKIIEIEAPSAMSFTCKDAIDKGSAMSAAFYSFIKLLSSPKWNVEDYDFLLWLIYEPALLVRQRAIDSETLIRHFSSISLFDTHIKGVKKTMRNLYDSSFVDALKINYLH